MHMLGIKVPKLGTIQDRIFRQYLTKESQKESKKVQLMALLTTNSVSFGNTNSDQEWASTVKKVYNAYLGFEYGIDIPESTEQELEMMDYYQNVVKKLKPRLASDKKGGLVVTGLNSINN